MPTPPTMAEPVDRDMSWHMSRDMSRDMSRHMSRDMGWVSQNQRQPLPLHFMFAWVVRKESTRWVVFCVHTTHTVTAQAIARLGEVCECV